MSIKDSRDAISSSCEEIGPLCFSEWIKCRRIELDLTQEQLAKRASCSVFAIRKIESGERKPSRLLAGLLAAALEIPDEDHAGFIKAARGELSVDRLLSAARAPSPETRPTVKSGSFPTNLPRGLTPFVGREPELAALDRLLRDPQCSFLTIVGLGGIGKTRLAIEAAYRSKDLFPDGIWFVPLAPLSSSDYIIPAIADALKFRFQDLTTPREQLLSYLHDKTALLVLDNAEHLLDSAELYAEVIKSSPQVKLLVTSRERINLLSEWVFELQGLPVPTNDPRQHFAEYSSAALFIQSARRNRASFEAREDESRWIVRICQVMEGLPLGIELAAAWVGMLTCSEIAREIEGNLDFLKVSLRDIPERHRSLRATLDHSWDLLKDDERAVLNRLSVFRGSFSREAAEEVCGATLMILSSLKNKSLVYRTESGGYCLHELIRQYAAHRLAEDACEDEQVKDRHALYYAGRLSEWEKALKSSRQLETLNEIELEIDNLRQAWQRMVAQSGLDSHKNTLFSQNLFRSSLFSLSLFFELRCRYWEAVNLFSQAAEMLKAFKDSVTEHEDIQRLNSFLGLVTAYLGYHQYLMHYWQAQEILTEALHLLENDDAGTARAQIILAWIYQAQGQYQKSEDLFQKSLTTFQQQNDEWWSTMSLSMLASIYLVQGKINDSVSLFEESLRRIEAGDLRLGVHIRTGLGYAHFFLKEYPEAERLLQESLDLSNQLGNKRQAAYNNRLLGQVALASGQDEQALKHFQECVDIFTGYGESPDLGLALVHLGKGFTARLELKSASETFRKVIKMGQALNVFHLIYWGLTNLARTILLEGQPEKALEMALILQQYSVESSVIKGDHERLLVELQGKLSNDQIERVTERIKGLSIDSLLEQN